MIQIKRSLMNYSQHMKYESKYHPSRGLGWYFDWSTRNFFSDTASHTAKTIQLTFPDDADVVHQHHNILYIGIKRFTRFLQS